jgi:soluble lytic murein transglycosylase
LHRAVEHWKLQSDPVPFALAEYNAGASRAQRWSKNGASDTSARTFLKNVDFPATRKYVGSIIDRYKFYKQRGRM